MWDRRKACCIATLLSYALIQAAIATPIYVPQFLPGSSGRNIRHLPCVSRRTGETGICMFAFTCAKANGTHLGTCIDRFYFGSCCKIDEEPDIVLQDNNSIEDGPSPSRPFVTTHGPIESNDIPEYLPRPKPDIEKKPATTHSAQATTTVRSTQSSEPTWSSGSKETTKATTMKTTIATLETTTQSIRLSTFQSVQNNSAHVSIAETTTSKGTVATTTEKSQRPSVFASTTSASSTSSLKPSFSSSTKRPTTTQKISTTSSPNVTSETSKFTSASSTASTTTRRPVTSATVTQKPHRTTTPKVFITTTQRTVPPTRFPPRNTTTSKPTVQSSSKRPVSSATTKRPTVTSTKRPTDSTKKPSSSTKRPTTIGKPSIFVTKPITATPRPSSTPSKIKPIATTTESTLSSTTRVKPVATIAHNATTGPLENVAATTVTVTTNKKPVQNKITETTTSATTWRTTTSKPVVTTTISNVEKPTKIGVATTTIRSTVKPTYETTTVKKPVETSTAASSQTATAKPTEKPTTISSTTFSTIATSAASILSSSTIKNASTVVSSTTVQTPIKSTESLEEIPQTTFSPSLVTWTSNSDETTTKMTSSTVKLDDDKIETDWTPITTPDDWIMIPSPTTEKSPLSEETLTTKVETTSPQTSVKPTTTESSSTTERVTTKPPIVTTLSSLATVTIDTETPLPMETLNLSDYRQVCGRRLYPEPRIVGGSPSGFGKWPWQISLRQWRTSTHLHKCGAALLNENWAITAAHCVENVSPTDLLLRIGEHDLSNEEEPFGFQERRVQIIASHPQFDPRTFEYDLALLRFYEPLQTFQPNILPICLPDDDETYVGRTAYVTGWGRLYDEGPLPSVLQEVSVPVINNSACEAMYKQAGYIEHIPHIFICAGWRNGGFDSCEGDSGGPMVIQRARDKRWILAGIISWGIGCAVPNQPGVYTRISEFREWINQILQF